MVFGGLLVKDFEFNEKFVSIILEQISGKTNILIKARKAPIIPVEIIINGNSIGKYRKDELEKGIIKY